MADDPNKTPEEIEAEAKEEAEEAARKRAIASIPAIFIDTWSVTGFTGHVRVTLGEIYGNMENFRTAVVLDVDDAISLGRMLVRAGERRKARDERAARLAAAEQEDTGES